MPKRVVLFLSLFFLMPGCDRPDSETISRDFNTIFEKEVGAGGTPIIVSASVGEGDSSNVNVHVKFDVVAKRKITFDAGWLNGISAEENQRLYDGEVEILYQKSQGGDWAVTWYGLARIPELRE